MIYLMSAYSHPDIHTREARFVLACEVMAKLLNRGIMVFSPICSSHPIAVRFDLPKGWEFWERLDLDILGRCDEAWVLMSDGWKESRGVKAEIAFAKANQIPVMYLDPDTMIASGSPS